MQCPSEPEGPEPGPESCTSAPEFPLRTSVYDVPQGPSASGLKYSMLRVQGRRGIEPEALIEVCAAQVVRRLVVGWDQLKVEIRCRRKARPVIDVAQKLPLDAEHVGRRTVQSIHRWLRWCLKLVRAGAKAETKEENEDGEDEPARLPSGMHGRLLGNRAVQTRYVGGRR